MADRIGFIGAGNMAGAIIEGMIKSSVAIPENIAVYDLNSEKTSAFLSRGIQVKQSICEIASFSNILFLSVKPQNYEEVLSNLKDCFSVEKTILVTIAAGISSDFIKGFLGDGCKVVRAMPNTPLLLGEGATALCRCLPATDEEFDRVKKIFLAGGVVEVLDEDHMNAVIAVNGSSPAYIYLFAKAVIDGAENQGIDRQVATNLIAKTLIGSAKMLTDSGYGPDELIRMVSSPGGTTLKALEALYDHDFEDAILDAMERCTARAEELGK
ncbi:MAG TPA: pyrroline-5-carboxylate reductase [Clostridia bacterium]|nr:pyrroline-5-carboxylate reductase [Clostridia bacterium]